MQSKYRFEYQNDPLPSDLDRLFDGINDDAIQKKQMDPISQFGIFIKDSEDVVHGGINGIIFYGCLYVDMLWISEKLRNNGLGKQLMNEAEKIARDKNCTFSTVNTMDWEALPFYQKLGYEIEFVREGYVKNSKMYLLRKKLSPL